MIKLYSQASHFKISYDDATEEEFLKSERLIQEKFSAKDSSLSMTFEVKKGWKSDIRSFYFKDKHILQIGFLKFLMYYYNELELEYEHIEMRKFAKPNKDFLTKLKDGKVKMGKYVPRDYQVKSVFASVKNKIGINQLPTGEGKSLIIALLCKVYDKSKVLVMLPRIDLVNQSYENFIDYGFDKKELGIIQGSNYQDDRRITFICVPSWEKASSLYPYINIVIADECHRLASGIGNEESTKILYSCQNAATRFGFSATPDVIENPFRQMALYANLGPIIYQRYIQDGIEQGSLANIDVEMYNVNIENIPISGIWADSYDYKKIDAKTAEKYIEEGLNVIEKNGKYQLKTFACRGDESNLLVFNDKRNEMIADLAASNDRVLILYSRKEHGDELERMLLKKVDASRINRVDGSSDKDERKLGKEHILTKNNILLASGIFQEGVDIKHLETLIIASAGSDTIRTIQRFGRATRKDERINKTAAKVIDFYDNYSSISIRQSEKRLKTYRDILKFNVKII